MADVSASSKALSQYAFDLQEFINKVSGRLIDLMEYHKRIGSVWDDNLYIELGAVLNDLKNIMLNELNDLDSLKNKIVGKAEILAEIESKTKF